MTRLSRVFSGCVGLAAIGLAVTAANAAELPQNDYPTVARADYVFACMAVNGQTREVLEKCSCSVDQIAGLLSWQEYEDAETIMAVQLRGGESVAALAFKPLQEKVNTLKRAQVEAELRCF